MLRTSLYGGGAVYCWTGAASLAALLRWQRVARRVFEGIQICQCQETAISSSLACKREAVAVPMPRARTSNKMLLD